MDINLDCIYCNIKKADLLFTQYAKDEEEKLEFMKKIFKIVSTSQKHDTAPYISSQIMKQLKDELDLEDIYYNIKKESNKLILSMEEEILRYIYNSKDRILTALKYAMVGNFIDFGAMDQVDPNKLKSLIKNSSSQEIDMKEYNNFRKELSNTKKIVYILDNAGEIVFDKLFIKILKAIYPEIEISAIVRGNPVLNDCTIEDGKEVGLFHIVNVIENGTDIPGTQLNKINTKSKAIIDDADLIISKGQGNFETLFGCGKNIYYIFLCKCDLFTKRFGLEKFRGVFANEKSIKEMLK